MDRRKFVVTRALTSATLHPLAPGADRVDVPAGTKAWANWDAQPRLGFVVVRLPESDDLWLARRGDFERAPDTLNGDQSTSDYLREYWHASARAPRPFPGAKEYDLGCDVLGAVRVATRAVAAAQPIATPRAAAAPPRAQAPARGAATAPPAAIPRASATAAATLRAPASAAAPRTVAPRAVAAAKRVTPAKKGPTAAQKSALAAAGKQLKKAQTDAQATGRRAIASAQRLTKSKRRGAAAAGKKLAAAGQRLISQAAGKAGAGKVRLRGEAVGAGRALPQDNPYANRSVPSDHLQQPEPTLSDADVQKLVGAVRDINYFAKIISAVSSVADVANELDPIITQTEDAGLTDVAQAGINIYNRCVDVINQYSDTGVDDSVVGTAAQIRTDATNWETQARQALGSGGGAPAAGATVTNADGSTTTTNPDGSTTTTHPDGSVTTTPAGTQTITSVNPQGGYPGDIVTVTGTGFSGVTAVSINNAPVSQFSVDSPTQLSLMIPPGATSGVLRVGSATAMLQVVPADAQPFDPGSYGGGGGGGGYGDGGGGGGEDESFWDEADDTVAQFRQSGGAADPFADEEEGPSYAEAEEAAIPEMDAWAAPRYDDYGQPLEDYPTGEYVDEGSFEDAPEASADEGDLGTGESEVEAFRESGGAYDPLADAEVEDVSGSVPSDTDVESTIKSWFSSGSSPTYSTTGESATTTVARGRPSPEVAARLAAAQQRAADARAQLAAAHVARGSAPPTASAPVPSRGFADRLAEALARMTGGA